MAAEKYQFIVDLKEKVLAPMLKISQSFKDAQANLKQIYNEMDKLNTSTSKVKDSVSGFKNSFGGLPGMVAGAFAVNEVKNFGFAVVDTLANFERFEAVLTNTLGSSSAAKKALEDITTFASNTPFQVDELSDSFVRLANQNFVPTMKQMTSLGDLASSVGKDFGQLTDAVIQGRVGEFEALKAFGITAKKEGDKVALSFKGQTKTIDSSSEAVTDYILSLGELEGVQGGMAAISKTTGGQISNLTDTFTQLKLEIGQNLKPVIDSVIGGLSGLINTIRATITWVKENADSIRAWAGAFVVLASGIAAFILVVKASAIATTIITSITSAVVFLGNAFTAVRFAVMLFNAALLANPIGFAIAGIAALAAAFLALKSVFPDIYNSIVEWFGKAANWVHANFIKPITDSLSRLGRFLGLVSEEEKKQTNKATAVPKVGQEVQATVKKMLPEIVPNTQSALMNPFYYAADGKKKSEGKTTTPVLAKAENKITKGLSNVTGPGRENKIINISIKSLVEVMNVHAASIQDRATDIKKEIEKVLLEATNNFNHAS